MKICSSCVLPETFPGISFDKRGVCIYCSRFKGRNEQEKVKSRYQQKFLSILKERQGKAPYDAFMAYSGGKDSTYTLRLLKEKYNLRILAITFDHGFISPMALENIKNVTAMLDIDQLTIRPGEKTLCTLFMKSVTTDAYPMKSLERASAICNSCMNLVKSFLLKRAIESKVPLIAYGWSPGQAPIQSSVFKTNPLIIKQMQEAMKRPILEMVGNRLSAFFLDDYYLASANDSQSDSFPYLVHPLAIMGYNEEKIVENIKELNWINPEDTDANSTNCLLNSFANEMHIKRHGFHPYSFEIAGLVREGYMTREEGLKKLSISPDPNTIEFVKRKLGANSL